MAGKTTRMSIDISPQDHRRLKMMAASAGTTLREFVIECIHARIYPDKQSGQKNPTVVQEVKEGKGKKTKDIDCTTTIFLDTNLQFK